MAIAASFLAGGNNMIRKLTLSAIVGLAATASTANAQVSIGVGNSGFGVSVGQPFTVGPSYYYAPGYSSYYAPTYDYGYAYPSYSYGYASPGVSFYYGNTWGGYNRGWYGNRGWSGNRGYGGRRWR
jgi:hypothetical protein